MTDLNGSPPVYAIRVSEVFAAQSEAAAEWLLENANPATARDWLNGLQDAKASLATLPRRCAEAVENKAFQKKRPGSVLQVSLYRHGRSTWRILFTIHEAEGKDQACVKLHQLRSAAQKPLTKWPDER